MASEVDRVEVGGVQDIPKRLETIFLTPEELYDTTTSPFQICGCIDPNWILLGRSEMTIYHKTMGGYGNLNINNFTRQYLVATRTLPEPLPELLPAESYQVVTRW